MRGRRRIRSWQPDDGKLVCSACGVASVLAPARGEPWPASPCCQAPPLAGIQRRYLTDMAPVFEVLNAGAVGSGKTDAGLMAMVTPVEYRTSPAFRGLVLRYSQRGGQSARKALAELFQRIERPNYWPAYVR